MSTFDARRGHACGATDSSAPTVTCRGSVENARARLDAFREQEISRLGVEQALDVSTGYPIDMEKPRVCGAFL